MRPGILALLLSSSVMALAQGTVHVTNFDPSFSLNAPVFGADCVSKLSGPEWKVTLLAGNSPSPNQAVGTTTFLAGKSAGYFDGGIISLPDIAPYTSLFAQIQVWNTNAGATYEEAVASGVPDAYGKSPLFSLVTGNGETNALPLYQFQWSPHLVPLDPPPKTMLTIFLTTTNTVALSWDSSYAGFCNLQQSADPSSTNWTWVSATPEPLSCYKVGVILPVQSNNLFYRLASSYTWP